jgi:predicted nuclease of restriction endonuclease-like (RecB) superfamily
VTSDLTHYAKLLADIQARIQAAQTRAVLAVNAELIRLYWGIGRLLDERQAAERWGAGVIPRLANDLRNELPELKGFPSRNLDRMLAFARAYPEPGEFSPQDSQAQQRQGVGASNFGVPLLAPQSELVAQALKDPYVFDLLTQEAPFRERELDTGLVQQREKFLLWN